MTEKHTPKIKKAYQQIIYILGKPQTLELYKCRENTMVLHMVADTESIKNAAQWLRQMPQRPLQWFVNSKE